MNRMVKWLWVGVLTLGVMASFGLALAQDATATETPIDPAMQPGIQEGAVDLEGLTADPDAYIGQTVTLEGVVENLVNVRAFVFGEGVALDNDQVFVVNASGQEFDLRLTDGSRFIVTGVVYASFANGGFTQLVTDYPTDGMMTGDTGMTGAEMTPEATPDMMNTTDSMGRSMINLTDMIVPDDLFDFTIVVLTDISQLQFVEMPQ